MSRKDETTNQINEQKGKRRAITAAGYALMIVFLLIILPVILPPIFGYHTYVVGKDTTGNISAGSLVYIKEIDGASYEEGNIAALASETGSRRVDVYYVDSNNTDARTLAVRSGSTVSYDDVTGHVVAKTPFMAYLSGLCFSIPGIIVTVVIFIAGLGLMIYANKISREINQQIEDAGL